MRLLKPLACVRAAILLGAILASVPAAAFDLVVIVSSTSPVTTLRADQAAAIFLGQATRLPDGTEAAPLDQPVGSAMRDQFYLRLTNKSRALVKAHWSKLVFTGRGQPPAELADSAAIRRRVAGDPAAIGYIDSSLLDPSVRAVLVVQ